MFLLFVRVYFALCPSYLHPDEIFQGPEPIAGMRDLFVCRSGLTDRVAGYLFPYPNQRTWEWTSSHPIRSVFPLWPFYGLPMTLLKWTWAQDEDGLVDPTAIYYTLRLVMFVLSFVLEDWAVHDLVRSPRHRRQAVILVTSSYVTWTFQSHTFSNSVETLLVLWSLVVIERIVSENVGLLSLPRLAVDRPLTLSAETLSDRVQRRPGIPPCFWHLQSNYFPCLRCDTRHSTVATLFG